MWLPIGIKCLPNILFILLYKDYYSQLAGWGRCNMRIKPEEIDL